MEEEEEGHLLLAEGSFFTLCQVQHHHHYAEHEHFYYTIILYIWKQTNSFESSIITEFYDCTLSEIFFQLLFLGLRQNLKCLS